MQWPNLGLALPQTQFTYRTVSVAAQPGPCPVLALKLISGLAGEPVKLPCQACSSRGLGLECAGSCCCPVWCSLLCLGIRWCILQPCIIQPALVPAHSDGYYSLALSGQLQVVAFVDWQMLQLNLTWAGLYLS